MIKYTVKRVSDNRILSEYTSDFAGADYYEENWGKPAYDEVIEPEIRIIHPAIEGVPTHDDIPEVPPVEEWTETIPAAIVHHESEYILEMVDITEEIEAKRIKKETKKAERESRVKDLSEIDWGAISTVASLKQIVKQLVKESLKDDE